MINITELAVEARNNGRLHKISDLLKNDPCVLTAEAKSLFWLLEAEPNVILVNQRALSAFWIAALCFGFEIGRLYGRSELIQELEEEVKTK